MTRKMSLQEANTHVMRDINILLDDILATSPLYDMELQKHCIKFQVEHATAKAAFQRRSLSPDPQGGACEGESNSLADGSNCTHHDQPMTPELEHLQQALMRMMDLGFGVASHVLKVTTHRANGGGAGHSPISASSCGSVTELASSMLLGQSYAQGGGDRSPIASPDSTSTGRNPSFRASSVDDVGFQSDESWLECGANLMHCATEILGLALVVHSGLRRRLQHHLLEDVQTLRYLSDAFAITKEHESMYFAVGYRTDLMKVIANLTYDNAKACNAVCMDVDGLFRQVLCGTKIDDENPHMVEWAEFALRNLMTLSECGREELKKMRALDVDESTRRLLQRGKVEHVIDVTTGKLSTKPAPSL